MGIRKLTTYLKKLEAENLWTKVHLENMKVIIDGNNLFHHLYFEKGLDCRRGGQYNRFHNIVRSFFERLESNKVQAFVVLDGADDPSDNKLETLTWRATKKTKRALALSESESASKKVLPPLAREVFVQTMRDLRGVHFAVCDFEADQEIASLAAKWECPVISEDSDFFIFDLKGGYIPLTHLDWRSGRPKAKLFKVEKLSEHLGVQKELLPLVASLLGNDFVSDDVLKPFYIALGLKIRNCRDIETKMPAIVKYFRQKNVRSLENGVESAERLLTGQSRAELSRSLGFSINSYKVDDSKLASYFEIDEVISELKSRSRVQFKPWVLRNFRQGSFPIMCMKAFTVGKLFFYPQVEDFKAPSSHQCSIGLRKFAYGVLENGETAAVTECERDGEVLEEHTVQPSHILHGFGQLPSLSTIPDLGDAKRRTLCLSLLESNTAQIQGLPAESQLFAATVRYWKQRAQPEITENQLRALLINSLWCSEASSSPYARPFNLAAQHSFAQWQCVMREAVSLNLILQEPLPTPQIRHLYDGLLVQELVSKLERGQKTQMLLPCTDQFDTLYQTVTDGIAEKLLP